MLKKVSKIPMFVLWTFVLLLSACGNRDKQTGGMEFRVSEALLGESVILDSLGITMKAPKNWERLPDSMLKTMHERLQGAQSEDRLFRFIPIRFFINHELGCVLSLSRVHFNAESTNADFNTMYRASLDQKFSRDNIHQTLFFKDDIEMNQLFIQIPERIVIKLLFIDAAGEMLQLDYMVPKEKYQDVVESIESSIGTVQRIKK